MTESNPISMSKISSTSKMSKIAMILSAIAIISILVLLSISYYNIKYPDIKPIKSAEIITLKDVKIAYAPETKQIIFLDRASNQVDFILSDSVSTAILALKSIEMTDEYDAMLKNKK